MVVQLDHVYIVKDGENYFGVSNTTSVKELIREIIVKMPFPRKLAIVTGLVLIWGTSILLGWRERKTVKRRYPVD